MKILRAVMLLLILCGLHGCGYNAIQRQDETVRQAWSEVLNQYQHRAELVPDLVKTVRGHAQHEQKIFVEVARARAAVGRLRVNADTASDAQRLKQFQAAQGELGGALSRLMLVSEDTPPLKADGLFQSLQAQLEATENRATLARNRYIQSVADYNALIRTFPGNLTAKMFGYKVRPNFSVDNEKPISTAITLDAGNSLPATVASAHRP